MLPRYAQPITGYDWLLGAVHCLHIIAICCMRFYDATGWRCDTQYGLTSGRIDCIDSAKREYVCVHAYVRTCMCLHRTIDFSFMPHDRTHVCATIHRTALRVKSWSNSSNYLFLTFTLYIHKDEFLNRYDTRDNDDMYLQESYINNGMYCFRMYYPYSLCKVNWNWKCVNTIFIF